MVLYKRKQVTFIRAPEVPSDLNTEVFHIAATKEWFLTYEDYLQRMDYYHRKKFVCEITGNSCLTFFQAIESETKEIHEVERNFPEALKEHILRFLQFNRITRLDQLVDKVYLVFKNDYFPGETIILKGSILNGQTESGTRQRGTIKEKIQYSNPSDGLLTKYLVVRANDQKQAIVINEKISRDRNHFTKWLIKAFIKLTMTRSHKVGAPWVVKNKFAKKYRINQKYPDDLKHFQSSTPSGDIMYEGDELPSAALEVPNGYRKLAKKPAASSSKNLKKKAALNSILDEPPPVMTQEDDIKKRIPPHHIPDVLSEVDEDAHKSSPQPAYPTSKKLTVSDLNLKFNLQYSKPIPEVLAVPENAKSWNNHLIQKHKEEQETDTKLDPEMEDEIKRLGVRSVKSIQDALETWVFLNVYHSVLKLDTFTFDDFIYAMGWTHDQFKRIGRCELLDEIWCAVLGAIVSNEVPKNKSLKLDSDVIYGLQITLPAEDSYINPPSKDDNENEIGLEERGSDTDIEENILKSEDDADNDESHESLEIINGSKDNAKVKSEQEVKLDDENDGDDEEEEEEEEEGNDENENEDELDEDEDREHNAYIVMNYRNIPWHERLRKRNFRDGNWQCILLGVLSLVEYVPAFKPAIDKVYRVLAPIDMPPTSSTVMNQFYNALDIDLKLQVLSILVSLLMNGTQVRNYIDECLDSSTVLRRNRLDNIRDYKVAYDLAQKLHVEIHEKLMNAKEEMENAKSKSKSKSKNKLKGKDSQTAVNTDAVKRRMPRLNLQTFEMTEQESKLAEDDKGFKDLCEQRKEALLSIEKYKQTKRQLEKQLNEIDCQRVKLLGKDRLYNRYWWFENNGLPTLHSNTNDVDDNDDDENTAANMNNDEDDDNDDDNAVLDETYLMGKLWVQGPSNEDLRIHFESNLEDIDKYHNLYLNYEQELENFYKCNNDQGEDNEDPKENNKEPFKQMNFNKLPLGFRSMSSEMFGLSFEPNQVTKLLPDSKEKDIVIDHLGGLTVSSLVNYLTPLQRKVLEENPDPLFSGSYWRFYDKPEQVTKLIGWLNPWGEREALLRKELLVVKEAIVQSMAARRKALSLDQQETKELELEHNIHQVTEKLKSLGKDIDSISNLNEDEAESEEVQEEEDEENEDELRVGRNKRLRNKVVPSKRQKTKSFADIIGSDNINELSKLYSDLLNELQEAKEEKELSRVLEWVNSKAIDKFDRSLYEGGDKSKARTKSNK